MVNEYDNTRTILLQRVVAQIVIVIVVVHNVVNRVECRRILSSLVVIVVD